MPRKPEKIIEPINAPFRDVVRAVVASKKPAPSKSSKNNELGKKRPREPAPPKSSKNKELRQKKLSEAPSYKLWQSSMDLGVEVQAEVNGVEMGVLENGIPYLTQGGLSSVTGVTRKAIRDITQEWEDCYGDEIIGKDRISFFRQRLFRKGYNEPKLYIEIEKDGSTHYAYPDIVCMTFLAFYTFDSKSQNQKARENYEHLGAYGLKKFVYDALQYTPVDKWKYHNDRVSILKDRTPIGYFTVFREIIGLAVDLINADLTVNEK